MGKVRTSRRSKADLRKDQLDNNGELPAVYHGSQNNVSKLPVPTAVRKHPMRELVPQNDEQRKLISAVENFKVVVAFGKAGTGKTFVPSVLALQNLLKGNIQEIIILRPNVPLGPTLGALPGSLWEKMQPWLAPYMDAWEWVTSRENLRNLVEREAIRVVAVEHLRGRTFGGVKPTVIMCDEVQNLGRDALKCLTQRLGRNGKLVLMGDVAQCDLPKSSPLAEMLEKLEDYERSPVSIIELTKVERSEVAEFFVDFWE